MKTQKALQLAQFIVPEGDVPEPVPFDYKSLSQRHHEILALRLIGIDNARIAAMLGVTKQTVINICNSSLGRAKLAVMRGARDADTLDVAKRIQELIPKALDMYEEIFKSADVPWAVKKGAADSITKDLGGLSAPKRLDVRSISANAQISRDDLMALVHRGREVMQEGAKLTKEEE